MIHWSVDIVLFSLSIVAALVALSVKDLMTAVVSLSSFSFLMALLYAALGAVDVAFNEAVIGAGITGVFYIFTIYFTGRRSND
jgi:energy-converting hydrogenase B subunit D